MVIYLERGADLHMAQLMHVCTSLQTDNHTNTSSLKFFLDVGYPSFRPTNSVKAQKATKLIYNLNSANIACFSRKKNRYNNTLHNICVQYLVRQFC